jgi:hypothetical protein
MAKIPGLSLSEDEVSQTIDFKEEFGVDLSKSAALKTRIGQAIIDRIIERTEAGKSNTGGNLKAPYSKGYRNSKTYEIYGKTGKINMTLKGDMLGSIDVGAIDGNTVKVEVDSSQSPKAYNHMVGDTLPKRPFFGVNKSELKRIKKEFANELQQIKEGQEVEKERQEQQALDLATIRALGGGITTTENRLASLFGSLFNTDGENNL